MGEFRVMANAEHIYDGDDMGEAVHAFIHYIVGLLVEGDMKESGSQIGFRFSKHVIRNEPVVEAVFKKEDGELKLLAVLYNVSQEDFEMFGPANGPAIVSSNIAKLVVEILMERDEALALTTLTQIISQFVVRSMPSDAWDNVVDHLAAYAKRGFPIYAAMYKEEVERNSHADPDHTE